MLAAMLVLAWLTPLFARLLGAYGGQILAGLGALVEHP